MRSSLSSHERGFVVAAVRLLGDQALAVLERRGPHLERAGRALLDDGVALAREQSRLDTAPPDGIERVHPSWWQPPPPSAIPAAQRYLARAATAHLVAMPGLTDGEATPFGPLDQLAPEPLGELLRTLGRRRVAEAFSTAPSPALAQLLARLGEPEASHLLVELRTLRTGHDGVRAAQRSLFKLPGGVRQGAELLPVAGARWLGPTLAAEGGDLLRRVAQRLPRLLGQLLLEQAATPITEAERQACTELVRILLRRRPG